MEHDEEESQLREQPFSYDLRGTLAWWGLVDDYAHVSLSVSVAEPCMAERCRCSCVFFSTLYILQLIVSCYCGFPPWVKE